MTLFTINGTVPGCSYIWTIAGPLSDPAKVAFGTSNDGTFEAELTTVGEYVLTIEEAGCDDDSKALKTYGSKTVNTSDSDSVSIFKIPHSGVFF